MFMDFKMKKPYTDSCQQLGQGQNKISLWQTEFSAV